MRLPEDPATLSVAELRGLVQQGGGVVPAAFLDLLASDPREGVRALARGVASRRRAQRREQDRLRRLLRLEDELWQRGLRRVAGVDEAGMGPLAGPVVAAAVVLAPGQRFEGLDDSKRLDAARREELAARVRAEAPSCAVGLASVGDIAERDIHQAGLLAMRRAVEGLDPPPEHLLVDARTVPDCAIPQDAHVKGDARSLSIAAASVVAKTHRDALMRELDVQHPGYGFARHQGYGTPDHLAALARLGPCPEHRRSWQAVAEYAGEWSRGYYELRDALRAVTDAAGLAAWTGRASRGSASLEPEELRRLERLAARKTEGLPRESVAPPPLLPLD